MSEGPEAPQLPRWKCHKEVEAFKIEGIQRFGDITMLLWNPLKSDHGSRIPVDAAYVAKHKPYVGGYYVRYADGYESFSPAEAFEGGYTRLGSKDEPPEWMNTGDLEADRKTRRDYREPQEQ